MGSPKQRISYFPLDRMDAEMQKEMDRCRREGTPRPESSAVRAHVPAAFWSFANSDRQKAALAYAEAITWHLATDDAFWERLHRHFSEPQPADYWAKTRAHHGGARS